MLAAFTLAICLKATPRVELLWKRSFGKEVRPAWTDIATVSDSGDVYWITSPSLVRPLEKASVTVTKVTGVGGVAFTASIDLGIDPGRCDGFLPTPDGGGIALVTRSKFAEIGGRNIDHAAVKVARDGKVAWTKVFVGTPSAHSALVARDGSLFVSVSNVFKRSLVKLDPSGAEAWEFGYEAVGDTYLHYVSPGADDGAGGLWTLGSPQGRNGVLHLNANGQADATLFLPEHPFDAKLTSESTTEAVVDAESPWAFENKTSKGVRLARYRLRAPGVVERLSEMFFELPWRPDQLRWLGKDPLWIYRGYDPYSGMETRYHDGLAQWNGVRVRSYLTEGRPNSWISHASMLENRVWLLASEGLYDASRTTIACLDRESMTPVWSVPLDGILREPSGEKAHVTAQFVRRIGERDLLVPFVGRRRGVARLRLYN